MKPKAPGKICLHGEANACLVVSAHKRECGGNLLRFLEARIASRDTFRPLPRFCNCYDVAVPILIGVFMSKFEAQRRLIPNAFLLFLATCIGLE